MQISVSILLLLLLISCDNGHDVSDPDGLMSSGMKDSTKINKLISQSQKEGNTPLAIKFADSALFLSQKVNYAKGIVRAYYCLAHVYQQKQVLDKALEYALKGEKAAQGVTDGEERLAAWNVLYWVYYDMKLYDKAINTCLQAIADAEKKNYKDDYIGLLSDASVLFNEAGKPDSAIYYGGKALELLGQNEDLFKDDAVSAEEFRTLISLNISNAYERKGDSMNTDKFRNRLRGYDTSSSRFMRTFAYEQLAKQEETNKNYKAAINFTRKAMAIWEEGNEVQMIRAGYLRLARLYAANKDYRNAFDAQVELQKISDSILNFEKVRALTSLQLKYETSEKERRILELNTSRQLQEAGYKKSKAINYALATTSALLLTLSVFLWYYYSSKRKTDKLIVEKREVTAMLDGQEAERKRIASDLHDRLGSMLATVKLYFNSVEENIDQLKMENKEQYEKANALLDEACEEVRKISHDLSSDVLIEMGLVAALRDLSETITRTNQIEMKVSFFGMDKRLSHEAEVSIYRIVQELVSNVIKYANGRTINLQMNRMGNNLNFILEDDGVGFNVEEAIVSGGLGLKNIQERVKKLGGKLAIDSGRGRGTTTIIDIPL